MKKNHHKTIVISDVHLGTKWSKTREAINFLRENSCETLILCGDIIDGWYIQRKGKLAKWERKHTKFLQLLLELQHNTKIIYVRGNHDDFLDRVLPIRFQNIWIVKDYIHNSFGKDYYVLHGDVFDKITSNWAWLAKIGDLGYSLLLWVNKQYNYRRIRQGKPYYSLAQEVKKKVKLSVSYISNFENYLVDIAHKKRCQGVICGHIHLPENKYFGEIHYLNSGDWIDSISALTENFNGQWNVIMYREKSTLLTNEGNEH